MPDYFAVQVQPTSQATAEALANNTEPMTPLRTKQAANAMGLKNNSARVMTVNSTTSVMGNNNLNVVVIGELAVDAGSTVTDSVYVGAQCGRAVTGGNGTVAIGNLSLNSQVSSQHHTLVGDSTGRRLTSGSGNSIVGYVGGQFLTTASANCIMGWYAAAYTATGSYNVLIGGYSGAQSEVSGTSIGDYNVGLGYESLQFCTGDYNIGIGRQTLFNCTGDDNIAIGEQAGLTVTSGSRNIFIGKDSGNSTGVQKVNAVNTICIGDGTYSTLDNEIVIGNASHTRVSMTGNLRLGGAVLFTSDLIGSSPTTPSLYTVSNFMIMVPGSSGFFINDHTNASNRFSVTSAGLVRVHAGTIQVDSIPTSAPGTAGRIWSDGGTLKITS